MKNHVRLSLNDRGLVAIASMLVERVSSCPLFVINLRSGEVVDISEPGSAYFSRGTSVCSKNNEARRLINVYGRVEAARVRGDGEDASCSKLDEVRLYISLQ